MKSDRERHIWHHLYAESKNDASEVIYKTEMDSDIENKLTVIKREGSGGIIRNLGWTKTQYYI